MPTPLFQIMEEDLLQPIGVVFWMCAEEDPSMYKSVQVVGVALQTNTVPCHAEMVRQPMEEAA